MLYFKLEFRPLERYQFRELMTELKQHLYNQPRWFWTISGFFIIALIGIIDHLTSPELFLSIFYFIPIFLVTWFTARWIGVLTSIASSIAWLLADFTSGHAYSYPAVPYWNAGVGLGIFLILTFLLSALKNTLEHEKELARTDALTGASNRRHFIELATMEINRARRYKHPFTLVHIDLDNFKLINDRLGYMAGDALLVLVAKTIESNIRATDILARLGGDEFVILLPETGPEPAHVITNKVQKFNQDVMQKNNWPVTLSIGVVSFIHPPSTVDEMLKKSDDLMYAAKNSGKNTIKFEVFGT
jgi:diguanylate cyclase (GGDEF)-like protein